MSNKQEIEHPHLRYRLKEWQEKVRSIIYLAIGHRYWTFGQSSIREERALNGLPRSKSFLFLQGQYLLQKPFLRSGGPPLDTEYAIDINPFKVKEGKLGRSEILKYPIF